ncbi:PREDICTED: uncharacterized protein LOC105555824 [Vollenhovia emeryi]|uniref:uncharacterized protein LOC105555824 n=1 Tax=Vollenhovia emeryi TaxID=411798 RepID=UPI0005F39956|nr:PREDICTED: uncharacterized protein LOC105555824 [Vollenhovia emeryi]
MPPIGMNARAHARVYEKVAEQRARGIPVPKRGRRLLSLRIKGEVREEWRTWLADPRRAGQRTIQAILLHLDEWVERSWTRASYRTTQVLTGHGCFGEYLQRMQREPDPRCHHCDEERDTAQHTLDSCPAWDEERRVLINVIGGDLSLPAVVKAVTEREEAWEAFALYCERVMQQKEQAERKRRGEVVPPDPQPGGNNSQRGGQRRRVPRGIPAHLRKW